MRADHQRLPFAIGTDNHSSYSKAFTASVKEKILSHDCELRLVKHLTTLSNKTIGVSEGGVGQCNVFAPSTQRSKHSKAFKQHTL